MHPTGDNERLPAVAALAACLLALGTSPAESAVSDEARLTPPETGPIPVAFVLSSGATMIDFTGPWEVFQDVDVPGRGGPGDMHPFTLFTVAESRDPIQVSGGMRIVPQYTFEDAPEPRVIVVPAQSASDVLVAWLRRAADHADMTMSVCTGAFVLAGTGLLDGRSATTHHDFYNQLARRHPSIDVRQGVRWVESTRIATAGGLTSGIDLALRIVARYFGEPIAERTATFMEHSGDGWKSSAGVWDATTDEEAARRVDAAAKTPPALGGLDPVFLCRGSERPGREDLVAAHGRYRYAFASEASREAFLSDPAAFAIQLDGACAYMAASGASPGSGDPDRYLVHDERIYIFATENCRESFALTPDEYVP